MGLGQLLGYPFMQHAILAILFAGIAFPLIGVFILSLNLIPLRFAMMHVALLGGAVGLFLGVDPLLLGLLFCSVSSLVLGPVSEKTKVGLGTLSGYLMTLTLADCVHPFLQGKHPCGSGLQHPVGEHSVADVLGPGVGDSS